MQVSTTYNSASLFLVSQSSQLSGSGAQRLPQAPARDKVDVSEQALESMRKAGGSDTDTSPTLQLLSDLVGLVTGGDVEDVSALPQQEIAASHNEVSLATESVSLSVGGTISTKDGKQLGFSLEFQYDHASLTAQSASMKAGADGIALSYEGMAAELSSTSFSFTLSAAGDDAKAGGKGKLHLNDEIGQVAKELKPLANEFMAASGLNGGWGRVNRFLRSVGS